MFAKLTAHKEREKRFKKIVDNPMLYLEERQHQILPEEHQPEIHSLRFFGPGAEGAAIEVLALIDWAAEFVEISRSPVPEIPGFLRRPFVKGKLVKHPIPDDPAESIHREKCVRTKAQKVWAYLCALLQFWTDEATTESGKVLYGGRRRPANPMIARINHLGLHRSIHCLDSVPPLLRRARQGAVPDGGRPNCGPTEPAGSRGRREMGKVPQGGSAGDRGPELLYSILGR